MSFEAKILIDGPWLGCQLPYAQKKFDDPEYKFDYSKIPHLIQTELAKQLNGEVHIVGTTLFASILTDVHPEDRVIVEKMQGVYNDMRAKHSWEVCLHEQSHKNYDDPSRPHRVKSQDREAENDPWTPKEKCVDMDLGTRMVFDAAVNNTVEIIVLVSGDKDYYPALKRVRDLGKRFMVVGMNGSTSSIYTNPKDPQRVRDLEPIYLDNYLDKLQLKYPKYPTQCGNCGEIFYTDYHPPNGGKVYCKACREEYTKNRLVGKAHKR